MEYRTILGVIEQIVPSMALGQAMDLADALTKVENTDKLDINDVEAVSRHALTLPEVTRAARAGKKINAIKELRTDTGCSLKVAKDAIEGAPFALHHPGMTAPPSYTYNNF